MFKRTDCIKKMMSTGRDELKVITVTISQILLIIQYLAAKMTRITDPHSLKILAKTAPAKRGP